MTDADYFPYLAKHERILNAPDAIFHDGKWRIFYCMPDKSHSEGVASADAIAGPFKTTFAYSRPRRIVPRPQ